MKLTLKKESRRARVRTGHPWVFINELENIPDPKFDGQALPLEDARGRHLGMGIVNTQSQIAWRRYSTGHDAWNREFFEKAIMAAEQNRDEEPFRRLIWSEADDLPGLVVDQFDEVLVVQALTKAIDEALPVIIELLQERLSPREVLLRNDAPARKKEGLEIYARTLSGEPLKPFWAEIYNVQYYLDLEGAQKTGFYLDQRQEHFKVATLAPDWRVLDAFCNQGAFALNCAIAGAREVVAIDSSQEALEQGRRNAEKNEVEIQFLKENVFDYFSNNREERFDMIILDPPSFAPNRRSLQGAAKGYKELHVRAFNCLNPGGILATYCCSHHVTRSLFREIIEEAASDTRRKIQIMYETGQPLDHPVIMNFPESEYLKGFVLRVLR
ncbi:class I SAM-dependent rRNA methyltransferase [Puniceicoccales bacterium CK1056]|uniref:Class I SAM-dependent rRNA methyltransferase n=1 Tax=Oceanipulchritudo coccoides TaxID=2706888 RepID=A0A6B2LZ97_9BACT|nr:class I SAM-dependent rRNA methyltransferase [Oceanipulchritudo coccoides]NDV61386.1 class I SAM-dependent rRNA methyltransferase [Oceanipulchritudo coccoides]